MNNDRDPSDDQWPPVMPDPVFNGIMCAILGAVLGLIFAGVIV